LEHLRRSGFLDADEVFYCAPGLHEWPRELEKQLSRRLQAARQVSAGIIVVYGERCFMDMHNPSRVTDELIREHCPAAVRIKATRCVDMLAGAEERDRISAGRRVYWLTPGWLIHWKFIFKDWDAGLANETFPQHDKAVVLDALGHFDQVVRETPEALLEISDWTKVPLEAFRVSLDRFAGLLQQAAVQIEAAKGDEDARNDSKAVG